MAAYAGYAQLAGSVINAIWGKDGDSGGSGGGGFGGFQLPSFAGAGASGPRQEVSQTVSSSTSVQASPVVAVSFGSGDTSPSGGGSSSATTPVTSTPVFGLPYASPSYSPAAPPPNTNDISSASAGLGGLFKDPLILVLLAGAAFLIFSAKKGK